MRARHFTFILTIVGLVVCVAPVLAGPLPNWSEVILGGGRFEILRDFAGQAVLDKETGLVWEKSPSSPQQSWTNARYECLGRLVGSRMGWRLPTFEELATLVDNTQADPSLPRRSPFDNIQFEYYWTATDEPGAAALTVHLFNVAAGSPGISRVVLVPKSDHFGVWCVRGGIGVTSHPGQ